MRWTTGLLLSAVKASELAVYWNQQADLHDVCENSAADIVILTFVEKYGNGQPLGFSMSACSDAGNCGDVGNAIQTCHNNNKKVFVSLGGAEASHDHTTALTSDGDARGVAWELHNKFLDSSSSVFGNGITVDGIDIDSEAGDNSGTNYDTLLGKLKEISPNTLLSAAPQCYTPDNNNLEFIGGSSGLLDYLFVQFYNNPPCEVGSHDFNFRYWDSIASSHGATWLLGLPASDGSASDGYVGDNLAGALNDIKGSNPSKFGGVMLWDIEDAWNNKDVNNEPYDEYVKSLLG